MYLCKIVLLNLKDGPWNFSFNLFLLTLTNYVSDSILGLFDVSKLSSSTSITFEWILLPIISILLRVGIIIVVEFTIADGFTYNCSMSSTFDR